MSKVTFDEKILEDIFDYRHIVIIRSDNYTQRGLVACIHA